MREVVDNAIEGSMHGVDIQGALCTVSAVALEPPLADDAAVDRACAEGRGEQFAEVIALAPELASSDLAKLTFEAPPEKLNAERMHKAIKDRELICGACEVYTSSSLFHIFPEMDNTWSFAGPLLEPDPNRARVNFKVIGGMFGELQGGKTVEGKDQPLTEHDLQEARIDERHAAQLSRYLKLRTEPNSPANTLVKAA